MSRNKKNIIKVILVIFILALLYIPAHRLAAAHVSKHAKTPGHSLKCSTCHLKTS